VKCAAPPQEETRGTTRRRPNATESVVVEAVVLSSANASLSRVSGNHARSFSSNRARVDASALG